MALIPASTVEVLIPPQILRSALSDESIGLCKGATELAGLDDSLASLRVPALDVADPSFQGSDTPAWSLAETGRVDDERAA